MKKTIAYSYLRISTERQRAGDGIRRQMEASEKYAQQNGYELVETIQDLGVSAFKGKNATEGAFAAFLAAIDDGRVAPGSVLIVESLDRLSRDGAIKAFAQFAGILAKGITIVTLMDGQVYSEDGIEKNAGQLFMSLGIMMRANDESVTKSKRLRSAWQKKRDEIGERKLTKMLPAWLELSPDRTEFIVREKAAEVVCEIYDLCINGMGVYSITRHFNGDLKKHPPISKAGKWNDSYIAKILKNPAVYGQFQPKKRVDGKSVEVGEPIKDYYPQIVSEERYYLAQKSLRDRRVGNAGRKGDNYANLFSNIVKCGKCGGSILMRSKGKPPKGFKYLRCHNSVVNNGCKCPAWRYSEFEEAFYEFVSEVNFAEVLNSPQSLDQLKSLKNQEVALAEKLNLLRSQYEAYIDRLGDPLLSRTVFESVAERADNTATTIKKHEGEQEDLKAQIAEVTVVKLEQDQATFLADYNALAEARPAREMKELRFHLHSIIRRSIETIAIYNGATVHPWEALDEISEKLGQQLFDNGLRSVSQLEEFFSTAHGQRTFEHSERYFVVRFKNGTERTVKPYFRNSLVTVTDRFAKFRQQVSN